MSSIILYVGNILIIYNIMIYLIVRLRVCIQEVLSELVMAAV